MQALADAVKESRGPGAVAYVGDRERVLFHEASGRRQSVGASRPAEKDTVYDLASLTKVVATTTAIMLLRDDGLLDLDQPVSEILPIPAFGAFTIRHCLTHTAGLTAGLPYYRDCVSLNEMLQRYAERTPEWEPGTRRRYSDVGFMILGMAAQLAARDSLDAFCAKRIFGPLGMARTGFRPPAEWAGKCAATEQCKWRGRMIAGSVHDENAAAVGGVAGHAGLFSTADDLARFCRGLLTGKILPKGTLDEMTRPGQSPVYAWQGLGWQLDPWACGVNGFLPARAAMGHSGWTGTSLWLDRDTGVFAILLGNTCHPSRDARNNRAFRRTFHAAVGETIYPRQSNTHTGLDRLMWEGFDSVRGKRVAVLTNHASIDQLGRHVLDVLALEPSVRMCIVYGPEHGLRGTAEAGEHVASEREEAPIVSLYGKRKYPSSEELAGIDLFIVDLQDVGSRYYTYTATMRDCLRACAKARKRVLVLDRPNPLGGTILEGPIAANTSSAVCCAPIPIRHGMTMGELARFFQRTELRGAKLDLEISTLDAWPRHRLFGECQLPWAPPSPNMPSAETALLYVGACLFEGTNLNEGRGTDMPFHVAGAPWLDAQSVAGAIAPEERAGCSLEVLEYTPRSIPGKASNPRYCGEVCRGIRFTVREPRLVRSFTLAVALLGAMHRLHPDCFEWSDSFDVLAGSSGLRKAIARGGPALEIAGGYEAALGAFDRQRPRLYE